MEAGLGPRVTDQPEQPLLLLSRLDTQIIRQIGNGGWAISKLGDTLASGLSFLLMPRLFGRKGSK